MILILDFDSKFRLMIEDLNRELESEIVNQDLESNSDIRYQISDIDSGIENQNSKIKKKTPRREGSAYI